MGVDTKGKIKGEFSMFVVGVRNNEYHNFKIVFTSRMHWLSKLMSFIYRPLFNEIEVQNTKNIVITDKI